MERKYVKFFNGKKPISIWRITFVNRFATKKELSSKEGVAKCYLSYFCFAPDLPGALNRLYKFLDKDTWDMFCFERFKELDYNKIYEV